MAMITVEITTDNEAFSDGARGPEVARIFRRLADAYEDNRLYTHAIMDVNGNRVGTIEDDDE